MLNGLKTAGGMLATDAPQLTLAVSAGLQNVLRGVAVLLVAVLLVMLLVKNIKFGRGGMGGGKIGAMTIVITLVVAAMLMDVQLFVTLLNWFLELVYEFGQWISSFLGGATSGGSGSVDIN